MPIFENQKGQRVLFVHVPKCGGSFIEHWFSQAGFKVSLFSDTSIEDLLVTPQHLSYNSISKLLGNNFTFDYAFSFVRDPYQRIESEYFFRKGKIENKKETDFSEWVLKSLQIYKRYPQFLDNHFQPQTYFLNKNINIFKLEDGIETGLSIIANELEINTPVPKEKINASHRQNVVWSRRAIENVNKIYLSDFVELGYEMLPSVSKRKDRYLDLLDSLNSRF